MAEKHTAPGILVAVALVLIYALVPPAGDYQLRAGHAACPTKQAVTEYRGARLVGMFAQARVVAARKCLVGPVRVQVQRRSTFWDLPYRVEINGQTLYADHDAIGQI